MVAVSSILPIVRKFLDAKCVQIGAQCHLYPFVVGRIMKIQIVLKRKGRDKNRHSAEMRDKTDSQYVAIFRQTAVDILAADQTKLVVALPLVGFSVVGTSFYEPAKWEKKNDKN